MAGSRLARTIIGALLLAGAVVLAVLTFGGSDAAAQQHENEGEPDEAAPVDELIVRLDDIERVLPDGILPVGFELDPPLGIDTTGGDALALRRQLDVLEPQLRELFNDADDARTPIGDAVALVARGWLDIWRAATLLTEVEDHDLAFPIGTSDADGVATGADELRLLLEAGIDLILAGHERHLEGYPALREIGAAEPAAQARFDRRAGTTEDFDADIRPLLLRLVGRSSTSVIVPVERFASAEPGVDPRASSVEIACVDRRELAAVGGFVTDERRDELIAATPERIDCPALDDELEGASTPTNGDDETNDGDSDDEDNDD